MSALERYRGALVLILTMCSFKGVDTPDNVPQALLDSADSIKDSVGSMQSLAVANPDLYINLADMINGTKSPEDVAKATQDQFAQLAKAQGVQGF